MVLKVRRGGGGGEGGGVEGEVNSASEVEKRGWWGKQFSQEALEHHYSVSDAMKVKRESRVIFFPIFVFREILMLLWLLFRQIQQHTKAHYVVIICFCSITIAEVH